MKYQKTITTEVGEYVLSLVTKDFLYYANEQESDENGSIIMTRKNGEVVSSNYFAYNSLLEELELMSENKLKCEYISESLLYGAKESFENFPDYQYGNIL